LTRILSLSPTKAPSISIDTMITMVDSTSSDRLGHEDFFNSVFTSPTNVCTLLTISDALPMMLRSFLSGTTMPYRDPCSRMAGQEGIEPPTTGFGDRCSAKLSYWPLSLRPLFHFPVQDVLPIETTVLLQFKTTRCDALVLLGRIVASFALGASQCYHFPSHNCCLTIPLTTQRMQSGLSSNILKRELGRTCVSTQEAGLSPLNGTEN
jgi:hypothetical protein